MSNDNNDDVSENDFRTVLAFATQEIAKTIKVQNDALVSVLNNEASLGVKDDDEHELAKEAYMDTKTAVETLVELSDSLDETEDDEPSVESLWVGGDEE